jgi:tetratricopeptide (TPR) repeat protein
MSKKPLASLTLLLFMILASSCSVLGERNLDQGVTLFNQGRFSEAIPYLEAATHDDPNSAQAYFYLGRAHISQSNWRAAIQPLRAAFRLAPQQAQQEIITLIIDAGFAAMLNDFRFGELLDQPSRAKPIL